MQFTNDAKPNERRTWSRSLLKCVGWPFISMICVCPLSTALIVSILLELFWLIGFIVFCPCWLMYYYVIYSQNEHANSDNFYRAICCGPVLCGVVWRTCGCGLPCACCMRS